MPRRLGRLIAIACLAAEGSDHGAVLVVFSAGCHTTSPTVLHSGAFSDSDAISVSDKQGVCYSKSCGVTGNLGAGDARGGNPVSIPV